MDKQVVDEKPCTWVGAFVNSHDTDENIFVGSLRFPGENLVLDRKLASFVEIYGQRRPVSDIPQVNVTLGSLKVNGQSVELAGVSAIYPKGVPDYADAVANDRQVVITVGQPVANRTQRNVKLLGQ